MWLDVTTTPIAGCNATYCRIKDKISGLEWSKTVESYSWSQAVVFCDALTNDGLSDWRLPTQKELAAAYDHQILIAGAIVNWTTYSQMRNVYYWSATSQVNSTSNAWFGLLASGYMNQEAKTVLKNVMCVR